MNETLIYATIQRTYTKPKNKKPDMKKFNSANDTIKLKFNMSEVEACFIIDSFFF